MQKCRNAAMQRCRNVEMQKCRFTKIYEHLRKTIKHCENRRKSANIYEHAERQKHGHRDTKNPINAKNTHFRNAKIHKSTASYSACCHSRVVQSLALMFEATNTDRKSIENLYKIYRASMDNLWNPNIAIPHYSPILSPLPHPPPTTLKSELSGLTLGIRT